MIRVLVVDDEQPARERLTRLLGAVQDIEVAGEASDGISALEMIRDLDPDAVFLDVEMPGPNGIEVASSLPAGRPKIVFCTAYEQYGPEAFDLRAVDYLLKPVQRPRLEETCRRLLEQTEATAQWPRINQVLARSGDRYVAVPLREVVCFLSEGGLTKLCGKRELLLDATLNDLEARLGPAEFFRVSRSALVRLDTVAEILPMPGGNAEAVLRDGRHIEVPRRRLTALMERLGRIG